MTELDRLLRFELEPDEACIDLDWSAQNLVKGVERLREAETLRHLAEVLGEGADVVNSEYPAGPKDDCVYSDITAVDQTVVARLSEEFKNLSLNQRDTILARAAEMSAENGLLSVADARDHYREVFWKLHEFVQTASRLDQTIATWWD